MANPQGKTGIHMPEDRNEFVEVYNGGADSVDLAEYTLADGDAVDHIVPWQDSSLLIHNPSLIINTTWLKPNCYAVILDPEYTDTSATGGFIQPYEFGDSALILTVGNTTIGDELQNNDPVTLVSPEGDTSTYGTPWDPTDSLPADAGDGFSWERIDLFGSDAGENWAVSPSLNGTPGRPNAIVSYFDLGIVDLPLLEAEPENGLKIKIKVKNYGYIASPAWSLATWLSPNDTFARIENSSLPAKSETILVVTTSYPRVKSEIGVKLFCNGDRDTTNNYARLFISPKGKSHFLSLAYPIFSPDNDGFEDSLPIIFSLPEAGGKLTVKIFDLKGKCIRTLCADLSIEESDGVVYWDGRRNGTQPIVPSGIYAVYLEYRYSGKRLIGKLPVAVARR